MGGRRIVYVNGFLPWNPFAEQGDTSDWRTSVTVVCDGGTDFFGVEYDPATREFRELHFNGVG